jgi:hypothetical protein
MLDSSYLGGYQKRTSCLLWEEDQAMSEDPIVGVPAAFAKSYPICRLRDSRAG